jgi:hypothetical protein
VLRTSERSDEKPRLAEDRRGSAVVRDIHINVLRLGRSRFIYRTRTRVRVSQFPADGAGDEDDVVSEPLGGGSGIDRLCCGHCLARRFSACWMNGSHER